ncbi:hypothetical protein L1N85_14975 [Paenibacillus alkaliterrae]|uniref:hypothetical protein n=1 Tax=Paenibacillus alkaliterrae TaxID=320909 RepID=UPI001F34B0BF|nr:hypothetical protein [Paenibacillus alkaliterrae]MCF2939722.1 hypothetical protein [Paenibacillus alkaliterrae]
MSENYCLMHKNANIGMISYDGKKFSYILNQKAANSLPIVVGYPPGLFNSVMAWMKSRSTGMAKSEVIKSLLPPNHEKIEYWLSKRVISASRSDLSTILTMAGFNPNGYDIWELNKYTKSISMTDDYWITDDLSMKYEDFHPKYLFETQQLDKMKHLQDIGVIPI